MKISIEQIIKDMPDNLTPLEELRYFYLQLGNIFSYNRDFYNITHPTILEDIYEDFITISMIENGNYQNKIIATCKQHAEIECDTLNYANREKQRIKARTVGYEKGERNHVSVIVTI